MATRYDTHTLQVMACECNQVMSFGNYFAALELYCVYHVRIFVNQSKTNR